MNDKEFFGVIEEEVIEKLKSGDIHDIKAQVMLEVCALGKANYWSRTNRSIRWLTGKDDKKIFDLLCNHLMSSEYYESIDDIRKKIWESK